MKFKFSANFGISRAFNFVKIDVETNWDVENVMFLSTISYFSLKCKFGTNSRWICSRAVFMKMLYVFLPKRERFWSVHTFLEIRKLKKYFSQTFIKYFETFLYFSAIALMRSVSPLINNHSSILTLQHFFSEIIPNFVWLFVITDKKKSKLQLKEKKLKAETCFFNMHKKINEIEIHYITT